mmetsp:Transcript_26003/g.92744  ORF Transcript_26003/g.92744 Transcript_26003/m.92744 type:complete len:128 (+) Transcript_26003:333-716(+)
MLDVVDMDFDGEVPGRVVQWVNAAGAISMFDNGGGTLVDVSDRVVYPYADLVLLKSRRCYCYGMGGNAQKDAALVVTAADDARGVTALDFWSQLKGPRGAAFFECNQAYLEIVNRTKPGTFNTCWGS